jgi:hypothetical protein
MLNEKQKEAVMYLCREWRKYHHVTEVDEFAFKVAEAVLALEQNKRLSVPVSVESVEFDHESCDGY